MSIENRRIQGKDRFGNVQVASVANGQGVSRLQVEGGSDHLLKELLVQARITNFYLMLMAGESNQVDEADMEFRG